MLSVQNSGGFIIPRPFPRRVWDRDTVSYHKEKINFLKFEFLSYLDAPWHCQQNIIKSSHSTRWFLRFFKRNFYLPRKQGRYRSRQFHHLLTKFKTQSILVQGQSLTVTPLTVTVAYSDTLSETKTITNRFQAVRVTNMRLQWHFQS